MNRPAGRPASTLYRRSRSLSFAPMVALLLALTALAPTSAVADRDSAGSALALAELSATGATSRTVASQGDPEPGIGLIKAVYDSLMDRFVRPLDSRDLLEAAWEGCRRALAEVRRLPADVEAPQFTGDRQADFEAFAAQYRLLVAGAGPSIEADRLAMYASAIMAQSVGEQHTYFLSPERFSQYVAQLTSDDGRVGLGILIQGATGPFTIGSVVAGSPAEKAGVKEGDQLEAVDGRDLRGAPIRSVLDLLTGDEGEVVTLTVRRGGDAGPTTDIAVTRGKFKDAPLTMRVLPEGVCHFRLTSFPVSFSIGPTGRTIGGDFDYYLEQCEQAGGKAWIVDLRRNGGGNAISETLGRFMDAGPIMVERDRAGGRFESATDGHLFRVQRPLIVLIDGESASASEVFASAVQEHRRGVVMGERSAGALNTTLIVRLPLGAGMGVTIRQVYTGLKEVVVDEVGVEPDVRINAGRDPLAVPREAVEAALAPQAGVGPLQPGPSTFEGMLPADELKQRANAVLLRAEDASRPEDRSVRGEVVLDTLHYYASDSPNLTTARARAIRLGWQGAVVRLVGSSFPSSLAGTVSYYTNADGAHKDLREIYEPDEPHNAPQWKEVTSPVTLGEETLAQEGTGQNEGRIAISWRRGGTVYSVSQMSLPGQPFSFDEVGRLAQIVDERAKTATP